MTTSPTLSPATRAAPAAAELDADLVARTVAATLAEDLAWGPDVTTAATVPADQVCRATFVARQRGVLAGLPVLAALLDAAMPSGWTGQAHHADGDALLPGARLLTVTGRTRELLTAERSALNLLCHLSGVATLTRAWVDAVAGTGAVIRDTRKTTPGLRVLEKYAVRCGGGANHRMGLGDAVLVKDNHVQAAGGVAAALTAVSAAAPRLTVEVECDTVEQVREALAAGARSLLLDNMGAARLREAVAAGQAYPAAVFEASGGLTLANAADVAATGVHYLAVGALTHSAPSLDIGLDVDATSQAPAALQGSAPG